MNHKESDLLYATKRVIANWEHGDLAAAVRNLDRAIAEVGNTTKKKGDSK